MSDKETPPGAERYARRRSVTSTEALDAPIVVRMKKFIADNLDFAGPCNLFAFQIDVQPDSENNARVHVSLSCSVPGEDGKRKIIRVEHPRSIGLEVFKIPGGMPKVLFGLLNVAFANILQMGALLKVPKSSTVH